MRLTANLSKYFFITVLLLFGLTTSSVHIVQIEDRVHILAANYAFDFVSWISEALWLKMGESAIASPRYFTQASQKQIVTEYLKLVADIEDTEKRINLIYTDPSVKDPASASAGLRAQLDKLNQRQTELAPLAEAVLEMQVTTILDEQGLTLGGQPIPWVLYHTTPLPQDLIISPRNVIQQETSYLLRPDMTTQQDIALEDTVSQKLNVSALVVHVGGLAAYPTMIMRTTALDWLADTISHEWIHLYLGQHPLGINYSTSPQLRTMNETTASLAGNEIGHILLQRYYPQFASQELASLNPLPPTATPAFDFRAEMHVTRVHADDLLAQGKIDEAEAYMEARRQVFWNNGYAIRKLNQAYFAFYGAYADQPGGAAGEDPVGPAVRELRARSQTLKDFLERIAQMDSFAQLQAALQ